LDPGLQKIYVTHSSLESSSFPEQGLHFYPVAIDGQVCDLFQSWLVVFGILIYFG